MRFGEASERLDAEFSPFVDEYLGEILEAVAVAWARMKPVKRRGLEDQITLALVGRLRHDPELATLPFDVVPQYWITDIDGRRLGRLDLYFKYPATRRDYFALEAKRLHVRYPGGTISPEYSDYAGEPGMGAFIEGQYSRNLPAAGMFGYVMDGDTGKAWFGIAKRIATKSDDLQLTAELAESGLAHHVRNGHPDTRLGETLHKLKTHCLRIFHLLLPVN